MMKGAGVAGVAAASLEVAEHQAKNVPNVGFRAGSDNS
jgi:hypothetical protein